MTTPSHDQAIVELNGELARVRDQLAAQQKAAKRAADQLKALQVTHGLEHIRMAYAEAGEWARHFSNVRMTVSPFLIGISLGVMSFAWDKDAACVLMGLAAVVWILMLVLMYLFTSAMNTRWHQQQLNGYTLGLHEVLPRSPDSHGRDNPTSADPPRKKKVSEDRAWLVTLILSLLVLVGQGYWWLSALMYPSWRPQRPQAVAVESMPPLILSDAAGKQAASQPQEAGTLKVDEDRTMGGATPKGIPAIGGDISTTGPTTRPGQ